MVNVTNVGNSVLFNIDKTQYAFPKGTIILTSNKKSDSVNVKLKGSRKTIVSILAKDLGYADAEKAINALIGKIY